MFGLVNCNTSSNIQLKASSIFAEINGFGAKVLATLRYFNDLDYDIEGLFIFPQDWKTTVVELEATIEERHVFTEVRDYIPPEQKNKRNFPLEEREDGLFCLGIGRIPPLVSVFVQVTLITELDTDEESGGIVFVLPSVFTPRLMNVDRNRTECSILNDSQILNPYVPRQTEEKYSFDLQLYVATPCLLAGCSSPTHAIQVDADSQATSASRIHITIAEPHSYDRELKIVLHLAHPYDPYVLIEEGRKLKDRQQSDKIATDMIEQFSEKAAIMISYHPQIESSNFPAEFIFLVDRSGSMSGDHIFNVKECLILFLKSLPVNCFFNIIGFGSYYRSVFHTSQTYSEESVEKATQYIKKMRADLGGTDLILPLKFIFDQPRKPRVARIVFLVTDGGVSNTLQVVDLVRRNAYTTSFYTFGIGPEACPNLLQGVASAGNGKAYFIADQERISVKINEALKEAMQPAITDIQVSWHLPERYDVLQTPEQVPQVFHGKRIALYGILSRSPLETNKESPRSTKLRRINWSKRSFSSGSVKVFWFDDDLEYLPDEQRLQDLHENEATDEESDGDLLLSRNQTSLESNGEDVNSIRSPENTPKISISTEEPNVNQNKIDSCETDEEAGLPVVQTDGPDPKGKLLNISQENFLEKFVIDDDENSTSKPENPEEWGRNEDPPARDSGLGYSLEEFEGSSNSKNKLTTADTAERHKENVTFEPSSFDSIGETPRPCAEGNNAAMLHEENRKNVFHASELLERLGLPKNFAAVRIKGYVGEEEIERIIPFPADKSRITSKQTTIHQLVARSIIRDLEASLNSEYNMPATVQKICTLSKQTAIQCRRTAIVGVDQYCYEDEVIGALQYPRKETEAEGRRKAFKLERKHGFSPGLGRRLPNPEGSDQETLLQNTTHSEEAEGNEQVNRFDSEEETQDFYRLERSNSADSEEPENDFLKEVGYPFQVCVVKNEVPPLSTRLVIGEKRDPSVVTLLSPTPGKPSPTIFKLVPETWLGFVSLANLQSPSGYWELTESFAEIIDIPLNKLQEASPLADSTVCISDEMKSLMSPDYCDYNLQLWATSLALAWLFRKWRLFYREEWCLVARKANHWMEGKALPRGFTPEDLKTSAFQALVLVGKYRRHSISDPLGDTVSLNEFISDGWLGY